ncbi:MAG TPA: hypothetical protein VF406_17825 [Thermodesulfobacteriota bacterium]
MSDGNLGYIVAAYGLVWVTLGIYMVRLWQRLGAAAREDEPASRGRTAREGRHAR